MTTPAGDIAEALQNSTGKGAESSKPTSARTAVGLNGDLIEVILSFFDPNVFCNIWEIKRSTRKALLKAALTSRMFHDPAMRYLWRVMESLVPLFSILPNFKKANDRAPFTIYGSISPDSLLRMRRYAVNIQHLHIKPGKEAIASHTLFRLSSYNKPDCPLFPALKSVLARMPQGSGFARYPEELDFQSVQCLFLAMASPSLTGMRFFDITSDAEDFTTSLLASAAAHTTQIQRLELKGNFVGALDVLPELHRLQAIQLTAARDAIPGATSKFLRLGNELNDLKTIILSLDNITLDDFAVPDISTDTNYCALETLEVSGSASEVSKFLRIIRPGPTSRLLDIKLRFPVYGNSGGSEAMTACLRECGRISPSLLNFQMAGGRGTTLPQGALAYLAGCSHLETLTIDDVTLSLVDEDIQAICYGGNWGCLQGLRLPASPDGQAPSLLSILHLSRACPNLHTLSICTDFRLTEYETLQPAISEMCMPNQLKSLSLIDPAAVERTVGKPTSLMLAIAVSRFMEHHFRDLETMQYTGSRGNEWWNGVQTMINQYRSIRGEMVSTSPRLQ